MSSSLRTLLVTLGLWVLVTPVNVSYTFTIPVVSLNTRHDGWRKPKLIEAMPSAAPARNVANSVLLSKRWHVTKDLQVLGEHIEDSFEVLVGKRVSEVLSQSLDFLYTHGDSPFFVYWVFRALVQWLPFRAHCKTFILTLALKGRRSALPTATVANVMGVASFVSALSLDTRHRRV